MNRFLRRLGSLPRNLFRRDRADAELDEELQAYVQMLADEKRAQGLPPDEALRPPGWKSAGRNRSRSKYATRAPGLGSRASGGICATPVEVYAGVLASRPRRR